MDYQVREFFSLQKIKDYSFRVKVESMDSWITRYENSLQDLVYAEN